MKRYRKGQLYKPPTAAEHAAYADAAEAHRRSPSRPQDYQPVGQTIVVKTPADGIPGRDGAVIFWAWCERCIHVVDATVNPAEGTATLQVDTEQLVLVHNLHLQPVAGDSYVCTALTDTGLRYALADIPGAVAFAQSPYTGIASGETAVLDLTDEDGLTIIESQTVYAGTLLGPVPASRTMIVAWCDGRWVVIGWEC